VTALLEKPVEAIFPVQAALALTIPGILAAAYLVDSRLTAAAVVAFSVCSAAWSAIAVRGDLERGAPMSSSPPQDAASGLSPLEEVLSRPAQRRPDVYLLVYDGLAPSAMMRHYGIDDEPTDSYLTDRGFKEYVGAHSLFLSSVGSMGSVMDMRYVPRTGIGGNNTAIRFFKDHGYTVRLVLNTWLLQNSLPFAADDVFPRRHYRSDLPFLYRGLGAGEFKSEIVFEDSAPAEWVEAKRAALGRKTGPPTMLYAHSRFPGHSQNSGRCLPDEVAQYATRLTTADEEMRGDIETILGNGREAIIIVAGDHGPYLTGDCLLMSGSAPEDLSAIHLYDRYGAKLLIRWPAPVPPALDRIEVLQDLIFGVAAYLLDDEEVWRYRLPRETVGTGNIPFRAIKNGIVAIGPDRGKPLYGK
jgi:hypothetical protein